MTQSGRGDGLNSAIYFGSVRHRRFQPVEHAFSYRLFQLYLDLDELDRIFRGRWLWSASRPALAWFRRSDHFGDPAVPLAQAVRDLVEARTGSRPTGPIRLLTHLRYFGYVMNPVSFYYCFDSAGQRIETVVAEVHNTPWGERHCYVMPVLGDRLSFSFPKQFHVSPFFGMDIVYRWSFSPPGDTLAVQMENHRDGKCVFDATLTLHRRPLSGRRLAWALSAYPFLTAKVIAAIYWQALLLKIKRCPFHPHPKHSGAAQAAVQND